MTEKITEDMLIGDILELCPESALIMSKYGLHCVGCMIATTETLHEGCSAHFLEEEKIQELVDEINKQIESNDKK